MSLSLERLGRSATRRVGREAVPPEFAESFPELASVMAGCDASEGQPAVPGLTLRLYLEGGELKANIGRWGHPTCIFLKVQDCSKVLEDIERILAKEGGEVRQSKLNGKYS